MDKRVSALESSVVILKTEVSRLRALTQAGCVLGVLGVLLKVFLPFGIYDDPREKPTANAVADKGVAGGKKVRYFVTPVTQTVTSPAPPVKIPYALPEEHNKPEPPDTE